MPRLPLNIPRLFADPGRHESRLRNRGGLHMHFKLLAAGAVASLILFAPSAADAACCDQKQHAHEMKACCADHQDHKGMEPTIVERFMENDPQLNPAPPVRQVAEVWFTRPTLIGRAIVQGRYVIEHDNNRMARGEPCTHVYAYTDQENPVATFHCTHLERDRADKNIVMLIDDAASGLKRLSEFQFAGENAAHGYPSGR
jgi:hypothetical protein